MIKKSKNYSAIAKYYDQLMSSNRYVKWEDFISSIIRKYKINKGICLDVACGTGESSRIMKKLGFSVVGIDKSQEMLEIARKKLPKERFFCSDIKNFNVNKKQDIIFVISLYDSLNYILTDNDLLSVFRSIARNISPGTVFLFDLNSRERVKEAQQLKPQVTEGKDFYSVFRFDGKGRIWNITIDLFVKENNTINHYREEHIEKGYDEKDVVPLLNKAGFKILEIRTEKEIGKDRKKYDSRIYFIVEKV